jgi:hypothetical protein
VLQGLVRAREVVVAQFFSFLELLQVSARLFPRLKVCLSSEIIITENTPEAVGAREFRSIGSSSRILSPRATGIVVEGGRKSRFIAAFLPTKGDASLHCRAF